MKQVKDILTKKIVRVFIIVPVVLIVIVGMFFWTHRWGKKAPAITLPTGNTMPDKVAEVIQNVRKKTSLPPDEIPNVATVSDLSKLQGQKFFAKAQVGDKVLIYILEKKAYLYRPSTDQVINVAPLEVEDNPSESSNSATLGASTSATPTDSGALRIRY